MLLLTYWIIDPIQYCIVKLANSDDPNNNYWLNVVGHMSGCPAYLGVVINNRVQLEELFRYDLLILCPTDFNLTFKATASYYY